MEPQYIDVMTSSGEAVRVIYSMTLGDIVISSFLALNLAFLILSTVIRRLWR